VSRPVFDLTLTAAPEHIDELGHVNNAVWVQWIQQVAVAHWDSVAAAEHKDAYFWVVVRHEIDYLRAAREGDRIVARTWVGDAPQGARFDRYMEFTGPDGKICVAPRRSGRLSTRRWGGRSGSPPR
jgi:acyl-CoA thioester hydrolase